MNVRNMIRTGMRTRCRRIVRARAREFLFLILALSALVVAPGIASATTGAKFTLLSAEYVGENPWPDDGHTDDLLVTFTARGIGNSKDMDIRVSAVREVTITCISALGEFRVSATKPISHKFSDRESPTAPATFMSDDNANLTAPSLSARH
jgi:hypothetical protein